MYPMTGPWRVVAKLDGGSYRIEHVHRKGRFEKKHSSMLSPYPLELVPFEPIDGPDHQFSQINRPISKDPFIEAGIKGFVPTQPFKLPVNYTVVHSADDFYWPSVSELNDELCPFPWLPGEQETILQLSDSIEDALAFYNGPPPAAPSTKPSTDPDIGTLATAIVRSRDKLFFISHSLGNARYREWRLVRVALDDSMSLHPSCLQDGKFLVEFYIPHSSDIRYNNLNQRYWLQYHSTTDIQTPTDYSRTHLVRPSDTSEQYARANGLAPLRLWVHLTHSSTYIHGPFDFASIRGRHSRDRISQDDWKVLVEHKSMYDNDAPRLDLPTFSVHVDRGIHTAVQNPAHCAFLRTISSQVQSNGDVLYC
jgi:hypothetical protein